jgi:hypothetical protein
MKKCEKHPHSSEASARKCYVKSMQKRAEMKGRGFNPDPYRGFVRHHPPRELELQGIKLYIFSEGLSTEYTQ